MAEFARVLSLPKELLIEITKHCIHYDWPDGSNAEHIISATNPVDYQIDDDPYRVPWVDMTKSSKTTIRNFRRVCKTFRDASWPVFGTIIGDRHFRLSENDLKTLRAISAVKELVPYISTLKFASTEVHEFECRAPRSVRHRHVYHGSNTELFRGAAVAGQIWKDRKPCSPNEIRTHLKTTFSALTNLANVRFNAPGREVGEYVAVWLTASSRPCSAMRATRALGSTEYNDDETVGSKNSVGHELGGREVVEAVFKALSTVKTSLQDVQFLHGMDHGVDLWRRISPHNLRTLRVSISCYDLGETGESSKSLSLPAALANMTNLEDLALIMEYGKEITPALYAFDLERHTQQLFQALQATSRLRRLVLEGRWALTQPDLLRFIEEHASTLKCLILYGPVLNGHWLTTLHGIADMTAGSLQYLSVKFALEVLSNGRVEDADFDTYTKSQWPHFTCATDFGPWFYLFPDEEDDEEEEEDDEFDEQSSKAYEEDWNMVIG